MDMVDALGLSIEYKRIQGRDGEYRHDLALIRLRPGMTYRLERSILAHELGHAVFADAPSRFGPVNAKQERRAWEWAALQLIYHDAYRAAEARHEGHPGAMAVELSVVRPVVEAYQRILLRTDQHVYVKPCMGAGQWSHREDVRA